MNPLAGDTVIPTNPSSKTTGESSVLERDSRRNLVRPESKPATRKRRQMEPPPRKMETPRKTPRHEHLSGEDCPESRVDGPETRTLKRPLPASSVSQNVSKALKTNNQNCETAKPLGACFSDESPTNLEEALKLSYAINHTNYSFSKNGKTLNLQVSTSLPKTDRETIVSNSETSSVDSGLERKFFPDEIEGIIDQSNGSRDSLHGEEIMREKLFSMTNQKLGVAANLSKDKESGLLKKPPDAAERCRRRMEKADDVTRLRKTIHWLEDGARRMREDLAAVRSELHEERKAAKLARRELDTAIREARTSEAARNQQIISDLKARLSQSPSRPPLEATIVSSKVEFLKEENHRRELSALKKRLSEAETTIRKLKTNSLEPGGFAKRRKVDRSTCIDPRKLQVEVQSLRAANKKLEEQLHMDEIRSKSREISKLEKLVRECLQNNRKLRSREDETMRKLRESERNHHIRLAPRIEEKIPNGDHVVDLCKRECEAVAEVERLRELAVEQQDAIEVLRQAFKEKERKLDQLLNKKRKEEFYKQWLELEPVAEVDDEEENEEGDSALSSAPSSLSPQPGGCGQWQANGVTREAYESVLFEVEELQTKLLEEQRELTHAKSQVRELEKALLQETRGSQNSRRALSDKLRDAEERESNLIAEMSDLREQNELLEFRVLELEESPFQRESPDPADSGIVSPEPIQLYKDQSNKHRDRAVATVIPYTSTLTQPVSPVPQKPPLSLQESGIFEEEEENEVELASCGTQTEAPAGELLQEVQRLQELRARIQERAVKVPVSVTDTKTCSSPEVSEAADIAQLGACQERIRDLEERLSAYEETEEKFLQERQLSKQRDEELLDENYKLTEKIYWLENELRNVKEVLKEMKNVETMTERKSLVDFSSQCDDIEERETEKAERESFGKEDSIDGSCEKIYQDSAKISKSSSSSDSFKSSGSFKSLDSADIRCTDCSKLLKDFETRMEELAKTEYFLRQQITVLERREHAFIETLKQADSTWSSMEMDYKRKYGEMQERLKAQTELNRVFFEHFSASNKINSGVLTESECIDKVVQRLSGVSYPMDVVDGIEKMDVEGEDRRKENNEAAGDKTEVMKTVQILDGKELRCPAMSEDPSIVNESSTGGNFSRSSATKEATEANEDEEMDKNSSVLRTVVETDGPVSQISLVPEDEERYEDQAEALITIDESESEKKVRHRWNSKEQEGWAMRTWNTNKKRVGSFGRNNLGLRNRRLILYKEICV
ncbi:janus kinase and microtubule-interacting protein 2-like isoform X2 [Belonocnema kinseyi]|uniref:janus kinase and microtubule-interacting protein 2-like isoform X2 n=1 Tax=Belonocnema kinseyi TaxID=2817044 RepID=UPI00143D5777|nr:janus kinase and microtubule-interacting protein 2-like isoform X2 [Belonocnema kinseyi]